MRSPGVTMAERGTELLVTLVLGRLVKVDEAAAAERRLRGWMVAPPSRETPPGWVSESSSESEVASDITSSESWLRERLGGWSRKALGGRIVMGMLLCDCGLVVCS